MLTYIQRTVSECFDALRRLRQIRNSMPTATFQSLVIALVMSKPDHGNGVLIGLPTHLVSAPPSVGACRMLLLLRVIRKLRRFDHRALFGLHWLHVPERGASRRRQDSRAGILNEVLHGIAPEYLGPVVRVADLPGRQAFRSASTNRLVVPPFKVQTFNNRQSSFLDDRS